MFDNLVQSFILIVTGFGSGIAVSIASGTAGAYVIPTFTLLIGYSIHQTIGTSLFLDALIGVAAGFIFFKHNKIKLRPTLSLTVSGMIGAFIGSNFTSGTSENILSLLIGLFLLVLGINFIINGIQKNVEYINNRFRFTMVRAHKNYVFIPAGLLIGLASGFAGMGSSGTVAAILLIILGYDLHTSIGTSLLMMSFIAGSGAFGHYLHQEIVLSALPLAGISIVIGSIAGASFANRIDEEKLGRLIGVIICTLGALILIKLVF